MPNPDNVYMLSCAGHCKLTFDKQNVGMQKKDQHLHCNYNISHSLSVHPTQSDLFLVTSKTTATFYNYSSRRGEQLATCPGSIDKEFGRSSGHVTQALFLRNRRYTAAADMSHKCYSSGTAGTLQQQTCHTSAIPQEPQVLYCTPADTSHLRSSSGTAGTLCQWTHHTLLSFVRNCT